MATPTKAEIYKLLKDIKPYEGATQIGVSTKKADRTPDKQVKYLKEMLYKQLFLHLKIQFLLQKQLLKLNMIKIF